MVQEEKSHSKRFSTLNEDITLPRNVIKKYDIAMKFAHFTKIKGFILSLERVFKITLT